MICFITMQTGLSLGWQDMLFVGRVILFKTAGHIVSINNITIILQCSTVGNVSDNRCVSGCRSRGPEFDPDPAP